MKSAHNYLIPKAYSVSSMPGRGLKPPRIQLKETNDHFLFLLKLPGLKKEDINLEVCLQKHLIIGTGKEGSYQAFTLPSLIQSDRVKASYSNQTLQVLLFKVTSGSEQNQLH